MLLLDLPSSSLYADVSSFSESPRTSQLSPSQLPYQTNKEQLFQRNTLIRDIVKHNSPIETSNSNLSFAILAAIAIFRKEGNKASKDNSDQNSDMSQILANKVFLDKNLESK